VTISASQRPTAPTLLWGIIAVLVGLFIAVQPTGTVITFAAIIVIILLAMVTPFAALLVLLVLSPLRTLIATEAPGQLPLDIGQIAFVGFAASYALNRIVHRRALIQIRWSPFYIPLFIILGATGLSAFSAVSLGAWLNEWLKWVQIVVVILLITNLVNDDRWHWLVFGLVVSGVANALVGIYQFFGGSGALHLVINGRYFRAFGTFGQPNPFGGYMGLLLPVALMASLGYAYRLWSKWRLTRRIERVSILPVAFYIAASVILLAGIATSWSRGAWLGLAVSLAVLAFALPRRVWQSAVLVALLGGILAMLWSANLLPQSVISRINSATQEYFTFTDVRGTKITSENYPVVERLAHWQAALDMASSHPVFGVGLGNYEVVYSEYRLFNWHFPLGHAHNYYLNILAETGIIGLLGYGKGWLGIIWLTWRVRRHPDVFARLVAIGLLGSWVYLAVHSLFDNLYVNNIFVHMGLMLAVLAVLYNQIGQQHKVEVR